MKITEIASIEAKLSFSRLREAIEKVTDDEFIT